MTTRHRSVGPILYVCTECDTETYALLDHYWYYHPPAGVAAERAAAKRSRENARRAAHRARIRAKKQQPSGT